MSDNPQPSKDQEPAAVIRGALYVDGFSLYYPIADMQQPHLKWLNLWRLGDLLCKAIDAQIVKVVFCTALPENAPDRRRRHITYNNALIASGVEVLLGHYVFDPDQGKFCEKQTDINVALSVICDAEDDVFDVVYLISADSDQAATAHFFKARHPSKSLFSIAPPNMSPPIKMRPFAKKSLTLQLDVIEASLFRGTVSGVKGLIVRPKEYDPPLGWVHPDDRPKHR